MQARRTPGQRAGLTRARVLAAARQLLADSGPEALTMRALAHRLDVSPNALYSHVASKTALIDDVLDDVLAQVPTPDPDTGDPPAGLYAVMAASHEVLLAHPGLVPLYLARQGARGAQAQRLGEVMLALLARAGIEGAPARAAMRVLIVYTIGFAAFATRAPVAPGGEPEPPAEEILDNFHRGLDWLLAGIGVPRGRTAAPD
ncbi:MAG TPA: TetR/AcrR family transcriptional regulator [Cryptosporangiaceae bacterium]|nr:TetR/AcrR family transcriptional regulator [Cryptosporangiaceae bacterium]